MKKALSKVICLMLTLSLIASLLTVFVFGEGADGAVDNTDMKVIFNRDFDDGWEFSNGLTDAKKNNKFFVDSEETATLDKNYFVRFESVNADDGYAELSLSASGYPDKKHTFIEFDFKVDDYLDLHTADKKDTGLILYSRTIGGTGGGKTTYLLYAVDGELRPFSATNANSYTMKNEWVHVVIDYDYTDESKTANNTFMVTVSLYNDEGEIFSASQDVKTGVSGAGLDIVRFGLPPSEDPDARLGMSWCMDNLKVYCYADSLTDLPIEDYGYGSAVNKEAGKTVNIEGAGGGPTLTDYLNNSIIMKVGVNNALLNQEKVTIYEGGGYGAPQKVDGTVYVPLEFILKYIGFPPYVHDDGMSYDISTGDSYSYITIGRDTATVDGTLVNLTAAPGYLTGPEGQKYPAVALDDVEALFKGYYVTYDDMGLIVICGADDVYDRTSDLTAMMNVMKKFIFDLPTAEQLYNDVKANTNDFQHPYLITGQDTLDRLYDIYHAEVDDEVYNEVVYNGLVREMTDAEKLYRKYSLPSGTDGEGNPTYEIYNGLDPEAPNLVQPYLDTSNGYDPDGGRLNETETRGNEILKLALAFHVTGDEKYAKCAYDFLLKMGDWVHWGPGHYLDVADGATPMSVAYDILYNKIVELGEDNEYYSVRKIAEIFQKHVMLTAMDTINKVCRFDRKQGNVYYNTMTNNWNAVCTSGVVMAALAIMEYNYDPHFNNYPAYISADNLYTLVTNGMGQYAPDGSYVESPGYWAYGTNCFYRLGACLRSSANSTYTLFNCWGLDKTAYFAIQAESSDYRCFNYHDGGMGQMDHSLFFFVGKEMGDQSLVNLRMRQLYNGKNCTIWDMFLFPFDEGVSPDSKVDLPLDYYMEGIDGAVSRSSWEKGAMYVGIIGGANNASHGQIDSGDFVYHNAGKCWIEDLGAENYNVLGYFGGASGFPNIRYRYYVMNAEGNNTLALTSDSKTFWGGQLSTAIGQLTPENWYSNEYGSYARIDQTDVYRGKVVSAWRGMLVTNDRKTVVIQDEVSAETIQSFLWNAHFSIQNYQCELSTDKRTAYLTADDGTVLRLSIVSNSKAFRFAVQDTYTFYLQGEMGTVPPEFSPQNGGVAEKDRSYKYNKLVVVGNNVLSFNLAVVIEIVDREEEVDVGYTWTNMNKWMPSADTRGDVKVEQTTALRAIPKTADIRSNAVRAQKYVEDGTAFTSSYTGFYRALTDIGYALNYLDADSIPSAYDEYIQTYNGYVELCTAYVNDASDRVRKTRSVVNGVLGQATENQD